MVGCLKKVSIMESLITLFPPPSFLCGKNQWAAKYVDLVVDGIVISVPEWYYDDNVLMKGDYGEEA